MMDKNKNIVCFVDIEIYENYGPGSLAQERFLVHGYDDVFWTSDIDSAIEFLRCELLRITEEQKNIQPVRQPVSPGDCSVCGGPKWTHGARDHEFTE